MLICIEFYKWIYFDEKFNFTSESENKWANINEKIVVAQIES